MFMTIRLFAKRKKEELYAGLFGVFLVVLMTGSITMAYSSIDSVILGTELNGNGTVEYLCLGGACESLQTMDW